MIQSKKDLAMIHVAVFLFGISGLFAKFLTLDAVDIVIGRTLFGSLSLGALIAARKEFIVPNFRNDAPLFLLGALLAGHWYSFFYAIQISTVSIALLTFSSFPVFVAVLEPLFFRTQLSWAHVRASGVVLLGIALIVPGFDLANSSTLGSFWGIVSGLTFAILQLLNRRLVHSRSPLQISFYENASACMLLTLLAGIGIPEMNLSQLGGLLILGVFCTALAHTLFILGLRTVRTQTASIIASLEPVYGIILAAIILREIPSVRTLIGGAMILGAAIWAGARRPQ